jgi:WD40 repeat protein
MHRTLLIFCFGWILSLTILHAQEPNYAVITPENVDQLRQVSTLGRGLTVDVHYADNDTIETVSYGGLWRYDANNLNTPPQWVNIPPPDYESQFSPDGRWMLTHNGDLWDIEQQSVVATFDTFSEKAEFAQDSSLLVYYERTVLPESDVDCLQDNSCMQRVILWDTATQMRRLEIIETDVTDVELAANDTLIAVIQHEQTTFYDATTGEQAFILPASFRTFSPDGWKAIAIYPADEENGVLLLVWDLGLQTVALTLSFLPEEEVALWQFNDDGTLLAVNTIIRDEASHFVGRTLVVWDIAAANRAATFPYDEVSDRIVFSSDNRYIGTVSFQRLMFNIAPQHTVTVFDLETYRINASIPNNMRRGALDIAFHPNNTELVVAYVDGRLQIVNTQTGEITAEVRGYGGYIVNLAFADNAIITTNRESEIEFWHPDTFEPVRSYTGCDMMDYHAPSATMLCHGNNATFDSPATPPTLQNINTGEVITTFNVSSPAFAIAAIHPDGQQIITENFGGDIQVWNAVSGQVEATLSSVRGYYNFGLRYFGEGRYLAAGDKGTILDAATGEVLVQPEVVPSFHSTFALSESGDWYVVPSGDSNIYVWRLSDLRDGELASPQTAIMTLSAPILPEHNADYGDFTTIAASPDGRLMVVVSGNGTAVYNMDTLTLIRELPDSGQLMRFSDDGRLLIFGTGYCYCGSADESLQIGHARVWAVDS